MLLCLISYNKYISSYTVNNKSTSYHDFLSTAIETIKEEAVLSRHAFVQSEDFAKRTMSIGEYIKFSLLRHKFRENHTAKKLLAAYKLDKANSYMIEQSRKEVDFFFDSDHDCTQSPAPSRKPPPFKPSLTSTTW